MIAMIVIMMAMLMMIKITMIGMQRIVIRATKDIRLTGR